MEKYLIIGSGPAGSVCAWRLAREGLRCILADRSDFPRVKICGGLLSGSAVSLLTGSGMLTEQEIGDITCEHHTAMTFSRDFGSSSTFTGGEPVVRAVNRTHFDGFLRRRAIESGAEPVHDAFCEVDGSTAVFKSGRRIRCDRIVGADGALSRVRSAVAGLKPPVLSAALSALIPVSDPVKSRLKKKGIQVFFLPGLFGYGWLFPRGDEAVLGLGSFRGDNSRLNDTMKKLMLHTGLGISSQVTGAVLPAGDQPVTPGSGFCLLTGDAAGLCDRVTGEGISHAVESGLLAAEAIISHRECWHDDARCVRLVNQSRRYRHLLYNRPFRGLAMKSILKNERWFRKYWSIISGTAEYCDLISGRSLP